MMETGIFANTFTGNNLAEILDQLIAHELLCVHFNMSCVGMPSMPDHIPGRVEKEIHKACTDRGIKLVGLSGTFNLIHPNPSEVENGFKRLEVLAASARKIGTSFISLCTGTRHLIDKWAWHRENSSIAAWKDLIRAMEHAITIAEKHNIYLGIEPEMANVVSDAYRARCLLDEMQSDRLRIILDPANLFEKASTAVIRHRVEDAINLLYEDIYMAHAKDRTSDGHYVAVGKGAVDFSHFIHQLKQADFDGPIVIHGLAPDEVEESLEVLKTADGGR